MGLCGTIRQCTRLGVHDAEKRGCWAGTGARRRQQLWLWEQDWGRGTLATPVPQCGASKAPQHRLVEPGKLLQTLEARSLLLSDEYFSKSVFQLWSEKKTEGHAYPGQSRVWVVDQT